MPAVLHYLTGALGGIAGFHSGQKYSVSTSDVAIAAVGTAHADLPEFHAAAGIVTTAGSPMATISAVGPTATTVHVGGDHLATVSAIPVIHASSVSRPDVITAVPIIIASRDSAPRIATVVNAGHLRRRTSRCHAEAEAPADRTSDDQKSAKEVLAGMNDQDTRFLAALYRAYGHPDDNTAVDKNGLPTNERDLGYVFQDAWHWVQDEHLPEKMNNWAKRTALLSEPVSLRYDVLKGRDEEAYFKHMEKIYMAARSDDVKLAEANVLKEESIEFLKRGVPFEHGSLLHQLFMLRTEQAYVKHLMRRMAHSLVAVQPGYAKELDLSVDVDEQVRHAVHNGEVPKLPKATKSYLMGLALGLHKIHPKTDLIHGKDQLLAHFFADRFRLSSEGATTLVRDIESAPKNSTSSVV